LGLRMKADYILWVLVVILNSLLLLKVGSSLKLLA
jgi:hypothetical protein